LGLLTGAVAALIGACLALPALAYVLSPLRRRGGKTAGDGDFQDLGPIDQWPVGRWQLLPMDLVRQDGWEKLRVRHGIWVRRRKGATAEIEVLSSICPHLGCPLNWHPDQAQFVCPCHGGTFDANGRLVSGPPPRSMDPLPFRVQEGRLLVRWQDFQIGVAESIPVRA
jgi:Rieske Fe-S protein